MKPSRVLQKLRRGERSLGVCLHLTDPAVYEMAGLLGFDAIWMDLEHHGYSVETAGNLMRAARVGGTDIVARPGKGEFMRLSRLLELGASGIMYPRCDSPEEAAEVVRWAKFAPLGQRGFDGSGPDARYTLTPMTSYLKQANDETFVLIQVEHPSAVEKAEEILSVPGVDMLMLGPADFSVLTGIPGEFGHASIQAAFERIANAAKKTGKHWAATCGSVEQAARLTEMGASLVFHGCDLVFVRQGLEQVRQRFSEALGMTFNPLPDAASRGSYLESRS
ncbi:2-keto-3-deoxy-L-rhamnonate aldolase [Caulifigura coniformis]|uniref:2-keto-3-deoxy-L-rhamnonate aldolase n=1 Tax=Caulifigura coniformis TaxID=2527983 RepID=A0A517SJD6_9PLAN|nr:aldolase/citrate lyase family protein [Caulifigura coniformis]QDT56243.1 2-keto-3-deoxy-L-rhamnonate aldolase [Caulifigura coniformis]